MKITEVQSPILQHPLDKELGFSHGCFERRTDPIVEVFIESPFTG